MVLKIHNFITSFLDYFVQFNRRPPSVFSKFLHEYHLPHIEVSDTY